VDGAVHSTTNADVVARLGLDVVIVVAPMSCERGAEGRRVDRPFRRLCRSWLEHEVRRLEAAGTRVIVVQPNADELQAMGLNGMASDRSIVVLREAFLHTGARLAQEPAWDALVARAAAA
jgi:NTE family protein